MNDPGLFDPTINDLQESVPEFQPVYDQHIVLYEYPLPHILFGELFDFAQQTYAEMIASPETGSKRADILKRIFDFIERCVSSDEVRINTVPILSFLNLLRPDEPKIDVSDPKLRTIMMNLRTVGRERRSVGTPNPAYLYFRNLLGPASLREWKNYTGCS
ncbi:MAG: hypothetical protein M3Z41_08960 [Candidatus Eremiobacteraeota bacterium]|nr:hypothetical protein [Candidatus Eremiobacteraeota bacterium]